MSTLLYALTSWRSDLNVYPIVRWSLWTLEFYLESIIPYASNSTDSLDGDDPALTIPAKCYLMCFKKLPVMKVPWPL